MQICAACSTIVGVGKFCFGALFSTGITRLWSLVDEVAECMRVFR